MTPFRILVVDDRAHKEQNELAISLNAIEGELRDAVEILSFDKPEICKRLIGNNLNLQDVKICMFGISDSISSVKKTVLSCEANVVFAVVNPATVDKDGNPEIRSKCRELTTIENALVFDAIMVDRDLTTALVPSKSRKPDSQLFFFPKLVENFASQSNLRWVREHAAEFTANDTQLVFDDVRLFSKDDSDGISNWLLQLWMQAASHQHGLHKKGIARAIHGALDTFESVIAFHGFDRGRQYDFDKVYTDEKSEEIVYATIDRLISAKTAIEHSPFREEFPSATAVFFDFLDLVIPIKNDGQSDPGVRDTWEEILERELASNPKDYFRLNLPDFVEELASQCSSFMTAADERRIDTDSDDPISFQGDIYLPAEEFCLTFHEFVQSISKKSSTNHAEPSEIHLELSQYFPHGFIKNDQRTVLKTLVKLSWSGKPLHSLVSMHDVNPEQAKENFLSSDALKKFAGTKWTRSLIDLYFFCANPGADECIRVAFANDTVELTSSSFIEYPGYARIGGAPSNGELNTAIFVFEALQKPNWKR